MEEIKGNLVWSTPSTVACERVIAEFKELPEEYRKAKHDEFSQACQDVDIQWMQEVVNEAK